MAEQIGSLQAQFEIDRNGGATYRIPLRLPPGVAGAMPELSLVYSNHGPNGLLGVGWMLDGLSRISRCPATQAQDRFVGTVNYSDTDRLSLDGDRLMNIGAGEYFSPGATYHTEVESWHRVTAVYPDPPRGHGPITFNVISREGVRHEYGGTDDSRVVAAPGNPSVREWLVSRVTDLSGNYITYHYTLDAEHNEAYPASIEYAGNGSTAPRRSIRFTYESRTDTSRRYLGGYKVETTQRMKTIDTYVDGVRVLSYILDYDKGDSTRRSRLRTITVSDASGNSLPPTRIDWQDGDPQILGDPVVLPDIGAAWTGTLLPMDVNGDGHIDLVNAFDAGDGSLALTLYLAKPDGSGFLPGKPIPQTGLRFGGQFLPMDVNGDGCSDLVYAVQTPEHNVGLTVFTATDTGSAGWSLVPGPLNAGGPPNVTWGGTLMAADIDGDGCGDLIYAAADSIRNLSLKIWFSDGKKFAPSPSDRTKTTVPFGRGLVPFDINGDGRTDLVFYTERDGRLELTLFLSAGRDGLVQQAGSPLPVGTAVAPGGFFLPVDVNGDGNCDLVQVREAAQKIQLRVLLSTGTGFDPQPEHDTGIDYHAVILPMDVNGDGAADLIVTARTETGAQVTVLLSNGCGFDQRRQFALPASVAWGGMWLPLDLKGIGKSGIVYATNQDRQLHLTSIPPAGSYPDLATCFTNGYGAQVRISYAPLTDPRVYSKSGDLPPWQVEIRGLISNGTSGATYSLAASETPGSLATTRLVDFPKYVVASFTKTDGRSAEYANDCFYSAARMDLTGRGWLGFESTNQCDRSVGTTTTTRYAQAFPDIGLPLDTTIVRTRDGAVLHRTNVTYYNFPVPRGTTGNAQQRVIQEFYTDGDLDYSQEQSVLAFDETFGNPLKRVERASTSGQLVYTTTDFYNDEAGWRLGYRIEEQVSTDPGLKRYSRTAAGSMTTRGFISSRKAITTTVRRRGLRSVTHMMRLAICSRRQIHRAQWRQRTMTIAELSSSARRHRRLPAEKR